MIDQWISICTWICFDPFIGKARFWRHCAERYTYWSQYIKDYVLDALSKTNHSGHFQANTAYWTLYIRQHRLTYVGRHVLKATSWKLCIERKIVKSILQSLCIGCCTENYMLDALYWMPSVASNVLLLYVRLWHIRRYLLNATNWTFNIKTTAYIDHGILKIVSVCRTDHLPIFVGMSLFVIIPMNVSIPLAIVSFISLSGDKINRRVSQHMTPSVRDEIDSTSLLKFVPEKIRSSVYIHHQSWIWHSPLRKTCETCHCHLLYSKIHVMDISFACCPSRRLLSFSSRTIKIAWFTFAQFTSLAALTDSLLMSSQESSLVEKSLLSSSPSLLRQKTSMHPLMKHQNGLVCTIWISVAHCLGQLLPSFFSEKTCRNDLFHVLDHCDVSFVCSFFLRRNWFQKIRLIYMYAAVSSLRLPLFYSEYFGRNSRAHKWCTAFHFSYPLFIRRPKSRIQWWISMRQIPTSCGQDRKNDAFPFMPVHCNSQSPLCCAVCIPP